MANSGQELRLKVERFVIEQRLLEGGERVLVACSGGADSVALLDLLRWLAAKWDHSIGVAHINHRQHPAAGHTARWVERLARRWRLPIFVLDPGPAIFPRGSGEEVLRAARYNLLSELARAQGYPRVATGHTRSDQAETILLRIIRGASPAGLAGIPARRGPFVRPLLACSRDEIRAYLKSRRLSFREDPTNRDRQFARNRVRHQILPLLRRHLNPAIDQALLRLGRAAARDQAALEQQAAEVPLARLGSATVAVPVESLQGLPDAVRSRLLVRMLREVAPEGANLEQLQVDRLLEGIGNAHRSRKLRLDLPGGVQAGVMSGRLFFRLGPPARDPALDLTVDCPGEIALPDQPLRLRFSLQRRFTPRQATDQQVFFDADRTPFPLTLRSLQTGDRLALWGGGTRRVSRLLIDAKIPEPLRRSVPLLVMGETVLWVAGIRRSAHAPVTKTTRRILRVELILAPASRGSS